MDGGKAISLIANNDFDIWDFEWEKTPVLITENNFPQLICIQQLLVQVQKLKALLW